MKLTAEQIIKDATTLQDRFRLRDEELKQRSMLRYGEYEIKIPVAYQKTSEVFKSPILREEGRQLLSLIAAKPVFRADPPTPEEQPKTTTMELFASAAFQELQIAYGNVDAMCASAQAHEKIGWLYFGMKRDYYADRPEGTDDVYADALGVDAYKRSAGVASLFEERFVPNGTTYWTGPVWSPSRFFEIKEVDEFELLSQYNIQVGSDGRWTLPDVATMISGYPENEMKNVSHRIKFIEYWDKEWCYLVCENNPSGWLRKPQTLILDSWQHGWGRVPYFPRPAFETEQMEESKRFESPLDGLYAEIKTYNRLRTILSSVAYMTGFAPLKIVTKEGNRLIMDTNNKPKTTLEFEPGMPLQLAPGQDALPVIVSPEAAILQNELAASESRIRQYSLSDIARGVSPGADTANSALSQLRRQQKSSLSTLNENQARQYREMWKFMLDRILGTTGEGIGETVYVFAEGDVVPLSPEDIVTTNVQVTCDADQGQDKLIEEKAALEAYLQGAISELEYHMRRGKENPEEYVRASALDRLRRSFEPELFEGIKALFGQSSALARLVAKNRENGDAGSAKPDIMNTIEGLQNGNGMGEGSPMMPRGEGVRSPSFQGTTTAGGEFGQ